MSVENNDPKDNNTVDIEKITKRLEELEKENKRLKDHQALVDDEKKQEKIKRQQLQQELNAIKHAEAQKKADEGNNEDLVKSLQEQLDAAKEEIRTRDLKELDRNLTEQARDLANKISTTDPKRAALLSEKIKDRLQYDGDVVRVLDKDKKVTALDFDALLKEMKTDYDFLCDGLNSSGGGSHSGSNTAAGKPLKKLSEYSDVELNEIRINDPAAFASIKN